MLSEHLGSKHQNNNNNLAKAMTFKVVPLSDSAVGRERVEGPLKVAAASGGIKIELVRGANEATKATKAQPWKKPKLVVWKPAGTITQDSTSASQPSRFSGVEEISAFGGNIDLELSMVPE